MAQQRDLSARQVLRQLGQPDAGLAPFTHQDPATDLRTVFQRSYRELSEPAARLFRRLATHPSSSIVERAAASLCGQPIGGTRILLAELEHANLIEGGTPGQYRLHDLLRTYAGEQAAAVDDRRTRDAAEGRLIEYFIHSCCAANVLMYPHRDVLQLGAAARTTVPEHFADADQAAAWLRDGYPAMLAMAGRGTATQTWQLAWAVAEYAHKRGYWQENIRIQQIALDACRDDGDLVAQARCHNIIARAHHRLGSDSCAKDHFLQAISGYQQAGAIVLEAHAHMGITICLEQEAPLALHHGSRALDLFRQAGDRLSEARALNTVGWWRAQLGDYDEALTQCLLAQQLLAQLGFAQGEGFAWDSIAYIHHRRGDYAEAIASFQRAYALLLTADDRASAAETARRLADSYLAANDPAGHSKALQQAVTALESVSTP